VADLGGDVGDDRLGGGLAKWRDSGNCGGHGKAGCWDSRTDTGALYSQLSLTAHAACRTIPPRWNPGRGVSWRAASGSCVAWC
jgi:hypothetical protein